jgi:hypothetical protein
LDELVIVGNDADRNSAFRLADRDAKNRAKKRVCWLIGGIVKV